MMLTTSRPPATSRRPPAWPRQEVFVIVSLAVVGLGLLATSPLLSARRQLLLAGSDLRASRGALTKRDDGGATAILDRADRHLAGAGLSAKGFPLGVLRVVP